MANYPSVDPDAQTKPANAANGSGRLDPNGHTQNPFPQSQNQSYNQPLHPPVQHNAPNPYDNSVDGLIHIISRQWHVIVLTVIAASMLAVLYLMVTKPVYTSVSRLRVAPLDPSSISSSTTTNNGNNAEADADFLETECLVIKSNAVLALAMDKIRQTRTLAGMQHPMDYVKDHLGADLSKKGQAIEVSFDSKIPDDANLIVDSVVNAYKEYESNSWKTRADDFLKTLHSGSAAQEQELKSYEQRMASIANANGFTPGSDPDKTPQHEVVESLREAREKARLETLRAHNAYEQAAKSIIGIPAQVKAVDEAEQRARFSGNPEDQLKRYQDELGLEQAKLVDDSRQFGPHHPTIITDQARVDQMVVATVVAAKQWEESAQSGQEAIEKALSDAEKHELEMADSQKEYAQLKANVDRIRKMDDDVDNRISSIDLTKGAGAMNIAVLDPAEITGEPKPGKPKTLLIGVALGMILGLGFACVRDWTDDRMRSSQAIRAAIGAPVLGGIPAITTAYTAADRGQIVHHDPFGDAAESFRTFRTALQYGIPTGAKTLLVTSPVSGDGKSTFVSNLGIAMAQANNRILIIDADFRAPMQHRLFGLKDRIGFATVLNGGDTMEQAIQRTEIEGLDVLPCGPTPFNPSELLNSRAFAEYLNDLADKYDMVILDSPPVTAVADARILAASADVSLLVVRLETTTRKQAEAAREGLRSVGARLIGVAVNGVSHSAHFGGASGYYASTDATHNPAARSPRRPGITAEDSLTPPAPRV